jgi:hypothetical protein
MKQMKMEWMDCFDDDQGHRVRREGEEKGIEMLKMEVITKKQMKMRM